MHRLVSAVISKDKFFEGHIKHFKELANGNLDKALSNIRILKDAFDDLQEQIHELEKATGHSGVKKVASEQVAAVQAAAPKPAAEEAAAELVEVKSAAAEVAAAGQSALYINAAMGTCRMWHALMTRASPPIATPVSWRIVYCRGKGSSVSRRKLAERVAALKAEAEVAAAEQASVKRLQRKWQQRDKQLWVRLPRSRQHQGSTTTRSSMSTTCSNSRRN